MFYEIYILQTFEMENVIMHCLRVSSYQIATEEIVEKLPLLGTASFYSLFLMVQKQIEIRKKSQKMWLTTVFDIHNQVWYVFN